MQRIYLDNNATTPIDSRVLEAMTQCWREVYANPGSRHAEGRRARQLLETSREQIASILGADPEEVIFTSGGTESTHLALCGLAQGLPGPIACTAGEHPATRETCRQLADRGWTTKIIEVDAHGDIVAEQLRQLPWKELKLVSVILAHNETGVIQKTELLRALCDEHSVPWHLDAVQAVGKIPVDFHALGATSLSLGAHKFGGPRGIGALLVRRGTRMLPQLVGGHQERDRRAGTEAVPLIGGMAKALEIWSQEAASRQRHLQQLRDRLEAGLREHCPPVVVHSERAVRLPNTSSIAFPGLEGEALLVALDLAGVSCSLGSACASGSVEPAPALLAMGCPPDVCLSSIRFSVGIQNTSEEIDVAVSRIAGEVARLRRFAESK
ncbi:MAG: cysteine desulfurase family protein [Planctomycetota bacterium]|nr:cysteine desulfurase family protein [Planctomycetota bacterium]MDA1211574.1 cysteine desulfurase family protein [Planctomycetota bacterium]